MSQVYTSQKENLLDIWWGESLKVKRRFFKVIWLVQISGLERQVPSSILLGLLISCSFKDSLFVTLGPCSGLQAVHRVTKASLPFMWCMTGYHASHLPHKEQWAWAVSQCSATGKRDMASTSQGAFSSLALSTALPSGVEAKETSVRPHKAWAHETPP